MYATLPDTARSHANQRDALITNSLDVHNDVMTDDASVGLSGAVSSWRSASSDVSRSNCPLSE